jgi:hypothetical protein
MVQTLRNFERCKNIVKYMFWVNFSDFGLFFPFLGPPLAVRPISVKKHPIKKKKKSVLGL